MIPADKERCQAEMPNGATVFTVGGVPKMIRCSNKPTVIITETKPGSDGQIGSMALCDDCLKVAKAQLPEGYFSISIIDVEVEHLNEQMNSNTFIEEDL